MTQAALAEDTVCLPGGLALGEGWCLRQAELRALSGREEEWLASHPTAPSTLAVTETLRGCLLRLGGAGTDRDTVRQLPVGDRDFLMLRLRALTLGEMFRAVVVCPTCRERMDVSFHATDVPVESGGPAQPEYALDLPVASGGLRRIRFRLPTGADQEAVLGLDAETARTALLGRCLLGDDGAPLTPGECDEVEVAMERQATRIDLELDLTCPDCGASFTLPFDTTAFFLQELRAGTRQLMREFHSLAFHYHWSEADILAMQRGRRRLYLSLLSDELRRT